MRENDIRYSAAQTGLDDVIARLPSTSGPRPWKNGERAKPGPKPGTPQAKHGGQAVIRKYGREFFARIGKRGGETSRERLGQAHYVAIGREGGLTTKRNRGGSGYYSLIGKPGGKVTQEQARARNEKKRHGEDGEDGDL
jgi:general stress protein YciG